MKVTAANDWRGSLPFDTPAPLVTVMPGEDARCFSCGPDSTARPRDELWAVKHRHPRHHDGFVRFYCSAHTPAPPPPAKTGSKRGSSAQRASSARAPRRPAVAEVPRPVCPDCFLEVPASGVCGGCGATLT